MYALLCLALVYNTSRIDTINYLPLSRYDYREIGTYLYYKEAATDTCSIPPSSIKDFKLWGNTKIFNLGFIRGNYWLCVPITNKDTLRNDFIFSLYDDEDSVYLFRVNDKTGKVISKQFDHPLREPETRPDHTRNISFKFSLEPQERELLFILFKNISDNLRVPMDICVPEDYLLWEQNYRWLYGWYFGYFFMILLFSLMLFIIARKQLFFWYFLYITTWVFVFLQEEYLVGEIFNGEAFVFISQQWQIFFILIAVTAGTLVMRQLVGLREYSPKIYKLLGQISYAILLSTLIISIVVNLLKYDHAVLVYKAFIVKCSLITLVFLQSFSIGILVWLVKRGNNNALIYLFALLVFLLGCMNVFCNIFAISNFVFIKPNGVVVGLAVEVFILSILVAYNYSDIIQNNKLLEERVLRSEMEMTDLVAETQEEEKKRIAKDLHDDLGGTLSLLKLSIENKGEDNKHLALIKKAVIDLKYSILNLNNFGLSEIGLLQAIQHHLKQVEEHSLLTVTFYSNNTEPSTDIKTKIILYRIYYELVNNVLKHAQAKNLNVNLDVTPYAFCLLIEDNGIGFDKHKEIKPHHTGISTIRERCRVINAIFNIDSNSAGTTAIVKIIHE